MFNLLGQGEGTGNYRLSGTESLLALEDAYLHVYGKPETGHLRKLGHVTVLGETAEAAEDKALRAFNQLEIEILGGNENDSTVLAG
jgi:5-(carboxyamino)imidazole ribonucleotide synthase